MEKLHGELAALRRTAASVRGAGVFIWLVNEEEEEENTPKVEKQTWKFSKNN